ncbi:MAG: F0F1-type ATP synthase assembly protein I [Arenicella sp.]|jgi:F0F1-type ATP synthase assembly protein I
MNNSDLSSSSKSESQFSEADSVNQATRHVMQPSKTQPSVLLKLALLQLFGTAVFSIAMLICFDAREALSALFGGLIAVIGSLYSAGRLFSAKPNAVAAEILIRFYVSVVLKFIFTLAMMAICLIVLKVSLLPFIIAYLISAVIINCLVLLVPSKLDVVEGRSEDHSL